MLDFIAASREAPGRRQVMRAFPVRGADRAALKALIDALEGEGLLGGGRAPRLKATGGLPPVAVVEVTGIDLDGEVLARPQNWRGAGEPPVIYLAAQPSGHRAPGEGDRVLARLRRQDDGTYEAEPIRRLARAPASALGVYRTGGQGARVKPTDRRLKKEIEIPRGEGASAVPGDLVLVETTGRARLGLPQGRVAEVLGPADGPGAISLIAIHTHGIPVDFPAAALAQAAAVRPVSIAGRRDMRDLPLVTIDGADARDFDDAVFAEPDPERPGGWHLVVAIADVSFYVRPGDALDHAALERGNSAYFPDRVVPMLPEALSNDLCSLRPHEDRAALAAHLWIDGDGRIQRHRFERVLMRSAARLTYEQVQSAIDGWPDAVTGPLLGPVIEPLHGAYRVLEAARKRRGALEIDMPERVVEIGEDGQVAGISPRARLGSHKIVEEFMIAANVAATEALEKRHRPVMYRVHAHPDPAKVVAMSDFLAELGLRLPKGQVTRPAQFNGVLARVAGTDNEALVNELVLRCQAQALYSPDNLGHFGLGLMRYSHFTSPIRRYADILVHRALVGAFDLGPGALPEVAGEEFGEIGVAVSSHERRAVAAERDAGDRYAAAFLSARLGGLFEGRVGGVTHFGLFVTLEETGADGFVPIATLPSDYYDHDERRHCLVGRKTGRRYGLGDKVEARLAEADPMTGSLVLEIMGGGAPTRGKPRGRDTQAQPRRGGPKRGGRRR